MAENLSIGWRDEAIEPPFEDGRELPITADWLLAQTCNYWHWSDTAFFDATKAFGKGLAEQSREKMADAQHFQWESVVHCEKLGLLLLADANFGEKEYRIGDVREFEAFARKQIAAVAASGNLKRREEAFTDYNNRLHKLWKEWHTEVEHRLESAGEDNQGLLYTTLKEEWQPRFNALHRAFLERVGAAGREEEPQPCTADTFAFGTSQEMMELGFSAADAKSGRYYQNNLQLKERIHSRPGNSHLTSFRLTPEEEEAGYDMNYLEKFTQRVDADGTLAIYYIGRLLARPGRPQSGYGGGWIELDDVIDKIGWNPRSTKKREEMRAHVWDYIRFGARAVVRGERTIPYYDRDNQKIDTRINGTPWAILKEQRPIQPSLLPVWDVPVQVEIVLAKEWEALMTNTLTAQYLEGADILCTIPGDKPGGSWARSMGLACAGLWRCAPQKTLAGKAAITRRELLTNFTPKVSPLDGILSGDNPGHAIEYYQSALQLLVGAGFLAETAETKKMPQSVKSSLPRYHWQAAWLDEKVEMCPGNKMLATVKNCADRLPPLGPAKRLPGPRRGRPRAKKTA